MAGDRRKPLRGGNESPYMAKLKETHGRRNWLRPTRRTAPRSDSEGTSKRETSNSRESDSSRTSQTIETCTVTSTKGGTLRILDTLYTSCEVLDFDRASAFMSVHKKGGTLHFDLRIRSNPLKPPPYKWLLEVMQKEKC